MANVAKKKAEVPVLITASALKQPDSFAAVLSRVEKCWSLCIESGAFPNLGAWFAPTLNVFGQLHPETEENGTDYKLGDV